MAPPLTALPLYLQDLLPVGSPADLGISRIHLPHLLWGSSLFHSLICCPPLTGSSPSDFKTPGDPPAPGTWTKTGRQFLQWGTPSDQVWSMGPTWSPCSQRLQALPSGSTLMLAFLK